MKVWNEIKKFVFYDTFGAIATANLLIAVVSGLVLALNYNTDHPYDSVVSIMLYNPGFSFFRNLHYWSGQLFLVFTLWHIWDHFRQDNERNVSKGIWLRLTLAVLFTFYVMLSGFILKGDADSLQAKRILEDLIHRIPVLGGILSYIFIGPEGNFQILYLQHIATATIFLIIVTWEHAGTLWVKWPSFLFTLIFVGIISLLIQAPIHDAHDPAVKGPWYFAGLQELLHWLKHPGISLVLISILILMVWVIPRVSPPGSRLTKKILLYSFMVYGLFTITGYYFRGEHWEWKWPGEDTYPNSNQLRVSGGLVRTLLTPEDWNKEPVAGQGKVEGCLVCHNDVTGFSAAHDPKSIGCSSCHLGHAYSTDKQVAHRGMILVPGNLQDTRLTCGTSQCHPDIHQNIQHTLMSTVSGLITVDKYVFGEEKNLSAFHPISELKQRGGSPAETHLKNLCASCHLGNIKRLPGSVNETSRGGGCNACHLNYTPTALGELQTYLAEPTEQHLPSAHPSLSLDITDDHCFGCHSRSGRIATNYEGWHETTLSLKDTSTLKRYRVVEESRVFTFIADDIHHQKGMECIDCHNAYELMGSDSVYRHEEDQVTIRCEDCHQQEKTDRIGRNDMDRLYTKIAELRNIREDSFYTEAASGLPLLQVEQHNHTRYLRTKNRDTLLILTPPAAVCTRDSVHQRLSCSACHTQWAPSCIGCHNTFEKNTPGFDLYRNNTPVMGTWVEYDGLYNAELPALGVMTTHQAAGRRERILPAVPGMILSIDIKSYTGERQDSVSFHRLFAPASPHTTGKTGRTCTSCHLNAEALGYGKGKLSYRIDHGKGVWVFHPYFASHPTDSLPEDAWTGFLQERTGQAGTREGFRPFTLKEQRKILTVGACLTCHKESSPVMQKSLVSWNKLLTEVSGQCILPDWQAMQVP